MMEINRIISNRISNYIRTNYRHEMDRCQLEILARNTFDRIMADPEFSRIGASIRRGNRSLITEKIKTTVSNLIVSSKTPWNPTVVPKTDMQRLVFNALRGESIPLKDLCNGRLLSTLLFKPDPALFGEARSFVQEMLVDLYNGIDKENPSNSVHFHTEVIVGDFLSLLPYLGFRAGEKIRVPMRIENEWKLVDYEIDRIELTPSWMGSPLVAYGLRSPDPKAQPLLLFKGTTFPSDEGASLSILTDLNPFGAVGAYAFSIGKSKIKDWIDRNTVNQKAVIYGKSLGGAQAWRTGINFPEKIEKVMAYAPPGFSPWEQKQLHRVADKHPEVKFNFIGQTHDPVPYSDWVASKGVNYYEVVGNKLHGFPVLAHAAMYATQKKSAILKVDAKTIANPVKRAAVTITRLAASLLFPLLLAVHLVKTSLDFVASKLSSISFKKPAIGTAGD